MYFFCSKKVQVQKVYRLISNIHFQAREGTKTRWDIAISNLTDKTVHENDIKCPSAGSTAWYISRQNNSWLRFWCQKTTNPYTQISNGRISASFYRLLSFEMYVREQMWNFWKTDKFLSFLVYLNQKWQKLLICRIYIFMYVKNGHPDQFEVAQLQKFFFLEFASLSCFQSGIMTT